MSVNRVQRLPHITRVLREQPTKHFTIDELASKLGWPRKLMVHAAGSAVRAGVAEMLGPRGGQVVFLKNEVRPSEQAQRTNGLDMLIVLKYGNGRAVDLKIDDAKQLYDPVEPVVR